MEMIQLGLYTSFKLLLYEFNISPVYTSCEVLASTWSAAPASTFVTEPERKISQVRKIQVFAPWSYALLQAIGGFISCTWTQFSRGS